MSCKAEKKNKIHPCIAMILSLPAIYVLIIYISVYSLHRGHIPSLCRTYPYYKFIRVFDRVVSSQR
ncbi:hypothetical protein APHWEB_1067 [Anaplasma phagocytophilum str. Webster]|nr:hypothetical protein APHWEB_1067 [Anaplasma phagocytophilum str. Webster]